MKTCLLPALLALIPLTACAQSTPGAATVPRPAAAAAAAAAPSGPSAPRLSGPDAQRAAEALRKLDPNIPLRQIAPSPMPGFQEAVVGGQVVYVSNDGRYLVQGTVYDLQSRRNLGEATMAGIRRELIAGIPKSDRIIFAPANPRYTVTVFTDVECGFCRRFHADIAAYNAQGIAVEYLAFPRMGPSSADFRAMEAIWCSQDRRKALTDAKSGRNVTAPRCTSPVAAQYAIGQQAGLTGTPMIIAADGTQLGGYLSPTDLRARLDALGTKSTP